MIACADVSLNLPRTALKGYSYMDNYERGILVGGFGMLLLTLEVSGFVSRSVIGWTESTDCVTAPGCCYHLPLTIARRPHFCQSRLFLQCNVCHNI